MDDFDASLSPQPRGNVPELTVSELAYSLKRTLEDTYGRVRVRGELSKVKIHTSGHLYSDLKDADAVLNIVCWRTTLAKLGLKPEEGLDVICTGKITSYPARSNYQMVIEQMELAGEGALLKMLEDRKKRLAAEGLFDEARKQPIPALPTIVGVVTSPTGAVIRDILHRIGDRFPRPVLVWPVRVQGAGAAEEIAAAINGFNTIPENGPIPKPDLLIVARGGGSLEDLMPFNEEIVVRAAANSKIPLISAVGHETDTTLIDFAADLRAPTPTAAAELAVPERAVLISTINDLKGRLLNTLARKISQDTERLGHFSARLGDPARLLDIKTQTLDHISDRLSHSLERRLNEAGQKLLTLAPRLVHPGQMIALAEKSLNHSIEKLHRAEKHALDHADQRLERATQLLELLSFKSTLKRGFAVLRDKNLKPVTSVTQTTVGERLVVEMSDGRLKTNIEEKI
ncbi:MAG TPA: exodeoxyribonuclease VII large subunit [Alphaproteobacteria bacterium]|nr:exodeoxyribonuclease VII large subunit [Alphaproteobacteria bacterium]HNS44685.1 exodeoxyribonuclease VII large subunit [Alphaproteobacteria bacterium]